MDDISIRDLESLCQRGLEAGGNAEPSMLQALVLAGCALGEAPGEGGICVVATGVQAEPQGKGWRLQGFAPAALLTGDAPQRFVIVTGGAGGEQVFVVPAGRAGLRTSPVQSLDELAALDAHFDNVALPASMAPRRLAADALAPALIALCAEITGAAAAALALAVLRARQRSLFSRTLGSYQALAHHLADARMDLDAMQLALEEAAHSEPHELGLQAVALKALCSAAGPRIVAAAQQVCGGEGYYADQPLHHYTRRVQGLALRLGGADHHHADLLRRLQVRTPAA